MTSGPQQPYEPHRGEYPPPVDYPANAGLPPPVYPGYPDAFGYAGYPYGPYPTRPPGTNGKAIASLVTSLVGLVFCGIPSIVGLILGIVAMRETRRTGQDGYGIALAGSIIGGLVTGFWLLYLLFALIIAASGFQFAP
ncbi:DUF4190 domain-containing protein [Mycobacterium hubeiense]|uniref:DUF4190 domain-containing protein n=1 Tax=Mycobacterium hubeiense TaxID=1867256 RepID=UPI000C7F565F|nr:DUF4190 domain-containing protein [Mycobacterium sp. QGD 101]